MWYFPTGSCSGSCVCPTVILSSLLLMTTAVRPSLILTVPRDKSGCFLAVAAPVIANMEIITVKSRFFIFVLTCPFYTPVSNNTLCLHHLISFVEQFSKFSRGFSILARPAPIELLMSFSYWQYNYSLSNGQLVRGCALAHRNTINTTA